MIISIGHCYSLYGSSVYFLLTTEVIILCILWTPCLLALSSLVQNIHSIMMAEIASVLFTVIPSIYPSIWHYKDTQLLFVE